MDGWGGENAYGAGKYMLIDVCVRSFGGVCSSWVVGMYIR